MIEDGLFERFPVQEVYGMHNARYDFNDNILPWVPRCMQAWSSSPCH